MKSILESFPSPKRANLRKGPVLEGTTQGLYKAHAGSYRAQGRTVLSPRQEHKLIRNTEDAGLYLEQQRKLLKGTLIFGPFPAMLEMGVCYA